MPAFLKVILRIAFQALVVPVADRILRALEKKPKDGDGDKP